MTTVACSSRVDDFMTCYSALTAEQQSMVRDMVELAWDRVERQLLVERLEASIPFTISAGAR